MLKYLLIHYHKPWLSSWLMLHDAQLAAWLMLTHPWFQGNQWLRSSNFDCEKDTVWHFQVEAAERKLHNFHDNLTAYSNGDGCWWDCWCQTHVAMIAMKEQMVIYLIGNNYQGSINPAPYGVMVVSGSPYERATCHVSKMTMPSTWDHILLGSPNHLAPWWSSIPIHSRILPFNIFRVLTSLCFFLLSSTDLRQGTFFDEIHEGMLRRHIEEGAPREVLRLATEKVLVPATTGAKRLTCCRLVIPRRGIPRWVIYQGGLYIPRLVTYTKVGYTLRWIQCHGWVPQGVTTNCWNINPINHSIRKGFEIHGNHQWANNHPTKMD